MVINCVDPIPLVLVFIASFGILIVGTLVFDQGYYVLLLTILPFVLYAVIPEILNRRNITKFAKGDA